MCDLINAEFLTDQKYGLISFFYRLDYEYQKYRYICLHKQLFFLLFSEFKPLTFISAGCIVSAQRFTNTGFTASNTFIRYGDMKIEKNIIGLVIVFAMVVSAGCGKKTPVQQPKFNKGAARDVIEGNTWYMKGCYLKALESFHKAYEKFTAVDDQEGIARTLNNLGTLYRAEKDYDSALLFFDEARRIFSSIGESRGLVQTLSNKAAVYTDMNDLKKAESALDEADSIAASKTIGLPTLKSNRALVCIRQKKNDQAKMLLTEALAMTLEAKPFEYATITHAMGVLLETSGEPDQALVYYKIALEADRKAGYSRNTATDLSDIGRVLMAQGKHEEALDVLYRSFNIQTLLNDPTGAEATSVQIKLCLETLGDKKPDIRVKEHFMKRWAEGEKKAGLCK